MKCAGRARSSQGERDQAFFSIHSISVSVIRRSNCTSSSVLQAVDMAEAFAQQCIEHRLMFELVQCVTLANRERQPVLLQPVAGHRLRQRQRAFGP